MSMGGVQLPAGRQPAAAEARARRLAASLPAVAAAAGFVVLALAVMYLVVAGLVHQLTPGNVLAAGPLIVAFGGVGVVVARRQPHNSIGWIMLGCLIVLALGGIAGFYAVLDYRLGHHGLPLAPVAVVLGNSVQFLAVLAVPLIILLFPDGRLPGPRWRWVPWAYAGFGAFVLALNAVPAIAAAASHDIRLDSSGILTTTGHLPGWTGWFTVIVSIAGVAGILLLGVRRQVRSWRQAAGERRQQLKWVAFGGAVTVVWLIGSPFFGNLFFVGIAALPVCMGIAILKYRLYDIDRIISRTLAYTIITGLLVGLYVGLVLLATQVLKFHSAVAVAASTLAAAALFNPLRRRVQGAVDRRFNRARYDADQTVAVFADLLKDAVDLDSVQVHLATAVHKALEPAHMSVWIRADERH
jgi:MFS family permease